MTRTLCSGMIMAIALMTSAGAQGKDEPKPATTKNDSLERLKKLAGEWVATDKDGKATDKVMTVFKVTSAGSAVQETIHPGSDHEMVTVYHLDGKDLVLTHYCALGNQPRLKADPKSPANQLRFLFAGGTNLDAAKDMHMHEGSITFLDDDHIEWAWVGYKDGKPMDDHKMSL